LLESLWLLVTIADGHYRPLGLPFRHALRGEDGVPFLDYLDRRVGRDRRRRARQLALLHEWDHLTDDLRRPPRVSEYAARWNVPLSSAYALLDEFRDVFPTEQTPERIVRELWDGLAAQQAGNGTFVEWGRVRVVSIE
jgi:hypothetical protein